MVRRGRAIMRQNDSVVLSSPGQNGRIIHTGQTDILNANNVEVRLSQQQAAHDITVEVLVRQQPEHGSSLCRSRSGQSSADSAQVALLTFDPLPNFLGLVLASGQVVFDLAPMTQVARDDRVHVGKGQRGIPLHDRLRSRAILEGPDNQFQQDTRIPDAESPTGIFTQRRRFGLSGKGHGPYPRISVRLDWAVTTWLGQVVTTGLDQPVTLILIRAFVIVHRRILDAVAVSPVIVENDSDIASGREQANPNPERKRRAARSAHQTPGRAL